MATYYDGLKDFFGKNDFSPLASSAQLVYLHLLQLNNRLGNRGYVQISDRELERLTNLNKNTITKAKRTLKNGKWIDFYTEPDKPHRGTTYTLTAFNQLGQTVGQTVGQTESVPIIRVREDVKTLDINSSSSARAREKIDEAQEHWELKKGGRLTFEHLSELQALIDKYGLEWLKARMDEASDANGNSHGLSMKFFRAFIKRYLKGGEKIETASPSYTKPARTGNEPWANY